MTDSKVKKIITGSLEIVKDSAEQIAKTVGPGALLEQAIRPGGQQKNELTEYLQKSGPNLSAEELKKRTEELSVDEQKQIEEARKKLKQAVPAHMKPPPRPPESRPYEVTVKDQEEEKAMQVEAQRKQSQQMQPPTGRLQRGTPGVRRKQVTKGFEGLQKDTKVG